MTKATKSVAPIPRTGPISTHRAGSWVTVRSPRPGPGSASAALGAPRGRPGRGLARRTLCSDPGPTLPSTPASGSHLSCVSCCPPLTSQPLPQPRPQSRFLSLAAAPKFRKKATNLPEDQPQRPSPARPVPGAQPWPPTRRRGAGGPDRSGGWGGLASGRFRGPSPHQGGPWGAEAHLT